MNDRKTAMEQEKLDAMVAALTKRVTVWRLWGLPLLRGATLQALFALVIWAMGLPVVDAVRWSVLAMFGWGCMLVPLAIAWGFATAAIINAAQRK